MKIHQVLLLLFFLFFFVTVMCSQNTRSNKEDVDIYTGTVGGSGRVYSYFPKWVGLGSRRSFFFCRNECKGDDLLLEVDENSIQSGRYGMSYNRADGSLSVTIRNLSKSDTGSYFCGLREESVLSQRRNFSIRVLDASPMSGKISEFISTQTEGKNFTQRCFGTFREDSKFLCKGQCEKKEDVLLETTENGPQNGRYSFHYERTPPAGLYVTIAQVKKADTGWYRCGYGTAMASGMYRNLRFLVINASEHSQDPSNGAKLTAYILPLVFVLLAIPLIFFFYKWKTRRGSGLNVAVTTDNVQPEAGAVYDNWSPVSAGEDPVYENINLTYRNQNKCLD